VPVKPGVVLLDGDVGTFKVTVGEFVSTSKVTGELLPAGLFSELGCVATAVYLPFARAGLTASAAQAPPVPGAVSVLTGVPSALDPEYTRIVTCVVSDALPVKAGVVLLERTAGEFNVTVGDAVLILKDTGLLTPAGLPSELSCVATAV
jgi:hypothetical protein